MVFLYKIDQVVIKAFYFLLSHLPIDWVVEIARKIQKFLYPLISKTDHFIASNYQNFYKLNNEMFYVLWSNREFILRFMRLYMYTCIMLYAISWIILTIILGFGLEDLVFIAELTLRLYKLWTLPISKFRFLIKYVFMLPYYLIELVLQILKLHMSFIKKAFNKNDSECMSGKSPEYERKSPLSSSQWEINCMDNKTQKLARAYKIKKMFAFSGNWASHCLDNCNMEEAKEGFKITFAKAKLSKTEIDNKYWCPSNYEREMWNKRFQ